MDFPYFFGGLGIYSDKETDISGIKINNNISS